MASLLRALGKGLSAKRTHCCRQVVPRRPMTIESGAHAKRGSTFFTCKTFLLLSNNDTTAERISGCLDCKTVHKKNKHNGIYDLHFDGRQLRDGEGRAFF